MPVFKKIISKGTFVKNLNDKELGTVASLYLFNNKSYVVRDIGRQYSVKDSDLYILENNIKKYYKALKKTNTFKVSSLFEIYSNRDKKIVSLLTEYFKVKAIKEDYNNLQNFKKIFSLIISLINTKGNINKKGKLNVSIDTNPDNFFIVNGKIFYNDFTPPLFLDAGGSWNEFRRIDEKSQLKKDKEVRYFSPENIIVNFLNKARLYLTFNDYKKLVRYSFKKTKVLNISKVASTLDSLYSISAKQIETNQISDFTKYITKRDILRFNFTLNGNNSVQKINEFFKKFKNTRVKGKSKRGQGQ